MKITMVRHTSVAVPQGVCYGQTDVPLADTFEAEAEEVRQRLDDQAFDAVYCSPLSRCRRLAAYCGYPDALIDERLLEMNFGDWEMQRWDEIADPYVQQWYADYFVKPTPGGESFADQQRRVASFIEHLRGTGMSHVCVFTHGGVIMQAMLLIGMATPDTIFSLQPRYGQSLTFTL